MDSEIKPAIVIAALLLAWGAARTDADYVAVNSDGYPNSPINHAREIVQGERFWRNQLTMIDQRLAALAKEPEENRKVLQQHIAELSAERRELSEYYRKNQDVRPTNSELKANRLRDEADILELRADAMMLNQIAKQEAESLKKVRVMVLRQAELHK